LFWRGRFRFTILFVCIFIVCWKTVRLWASVCCMEWKQKTYFQVREARRRLVWTAFSKWEKKLALEPTIVDEERRRAQ
jgi:hypothetical protein